MRTYIALFRGINVGGKGILPMRELVGILEQLGCDKVKTYIQSGNVVFRIEEARREEIVGEISARVREERGFRPKVLLLELTDVLEAVENNPFDTSIGKALHFFFLETTPEAPDLEKLSTIKTATEDFALKGKVFYLYAPDGVGRSKLAARAEKSLGVAVTARNWNTVAKLIEMARKD